MLYAKAKYGNMDPYFCIKLQNWIFTNCFANVPLTCSVCLPMIYLKPICDLLNSRIQEMSCPITNLNPRTPKHLYDVLIHECGNIGCFVRLHRLSSTHLGKYSVATRTTVMTSSTSCLSYLCFLFLFPVFYKFGRAWYFFFLCVPDWPWFLHLLSPRYDNWETPKGGHHTCRCPFQSQVATMVEFHHWIQRREQISFGSPS